MMKLQTNNFDDRWAELTQGMTPQQVDTFAYGLVGSMSWYLDQETLEHCLLTAEVLHLRDLRRHKLELVKGGKQ